MARSYGDNVLKRHYPRSNLINTHQPNLILLYNV